MCERASQTLDSCPQICLQLSMYLVMQKLVERSIGGAENVKL